MKRSEKEILIYEILEMIEPRIRFKSYNPTIKEQIYITEQLNLILNPIEKIERICKKIRKREVKKSEQTKNEKEKP